ncbi:pentapeptide repeat protein [Roseibium sp. TrichSKD4]|uniref:pentapeptide repeat-containing protein n=1 Tax=Roseibium sp. TrichSKD4 TaxID=744980 RepID=UPI0001E56786|nr:pentapeptide repeat-containing protein [Roseibium sp. TrichSKD4]EFO31696.1 pentapeptide repeat protein [Roseibium sp. TrichSKD4]
MANPEHLKWLAENDVEAWNERRRLSPIVADLEGADLREANLEWADLWGANLQQAKLQQADLRLAILQEAKLQEADLRGAKLQQADLRGAKLQQADLRLAKLQQAKLWGADLQEADLQEADLRGADLRGAKLQEADLRGAKLQEADLRGAKLQEADLRGAKLRGADLRGAKLEWAKLEWAKLEWADVRTVKSSLAVSGFARADFTHTGYLTQKQVDSMRGDTGVLLPEGLKHPAHWPKWEGDEEAGTKNSDTHTPSDDLERRLADTGSVTSIVRDGKIDIVSTPPDGRPAANDPSDRDQLFDAIDYACGRFREAWETENPQVDKKGILAAIDKCRGLAQEHDLNWYKWIELSLDLADYLKSNPEEDAWRTLDRKTQRIIGMIGQLEKYLKPLPNEEAGVHDLREPEIEITAETETRLPELIDEIDKLARAIQAPPVQNIFYGDVGKFVQTQAHTIKNEQHPTHLPDEYSNPVSQGKWTRALRGIAGFTVTLLGNLAVGGLSGVLGNTLTTDTAWPYFVSLLEKVRDLLLMFFKSS